MSYSRIIADFHRDISLIDYIDWKLKAWGRAKRKTLASGSRRTKDGLFEAGSVRSLTGRIMEEGPVGAAIHNSFLEPREGLRGDALEASLALQRAILTGTLDDRTYETVFVHYVVRAPIKAKLKALSVSRAAYYAAIGRAHNRLEPHLP